jgi:hypothetical protein
LLANDQKWKSVHLALRWAARLLSVLSTGVLLLFLFGEPFPVGQITSKEWIGLALFPLGIVIGFAVAWPRERLGWVITITSLLVFCFLFVNDFSKSWAFLIFAFPGFLFLMSGFFDRRRLTDARN